MAGFRLHRRLLRHGQGQDAVFIRGGDALLVDLGNIEAAGVGAVVTLTAQVGTVFVLLILILAVLGLDDEDIVVDVDLDLFLLEAGQIARPI